MNGPPLLAAWMLGKREIVRFLRQRNRIVGAIGTPLLFWALFGAGLHGSFRVTGEGGPGQSFSDYYLPGSALLIVLFTAIFTTISVIEDRREGFLQAVLVSPVPRWEMVLGKVWGGSVLAVLQAVIFLAFALLLNGGVSWLSFLLLIPLFFLSAAALTGLGFVFAWNTDSTQGFHAVMNLVLMPLWLLSGAFFPAPQPVAGGPASQYFIHWAVRLNPLSYAVAGTRQIMFGNLDWEGVWMPSLPLCWLVTAMFALVMFAAACAVTGQRQTGDHL